MNKIWSRETKEQGWVGYPGYAGDGKPLWFILLGGRLGQSHLSTMMRIKMSTFIRRQINTTSIDPLGWRKPTNKSLAKNVLFLMNFNVMYMKWAFSHLFQNNCIWFQLFSLTQWKELFLSSTDFNLA